MNVCFRVDSSHQMGIGHLMRCMVLAENLRQQGHTVTFICRELPGNYIFTLKSKHFPVIVLPYDASTAVSLLHLPQHQQWLGALSEIDLQQTLAYLSQVRNIDWLVVDHYGLDIAWEAACRPYTKKILIIDDLADRLHDGDILVDQNYYLHSSSRYENRVPSQCKTFIGPHYALLRAEFHEIRQKINQRVGDIRRLMVSLGGSDTSNGTQKVLQGIHHSVFKDLSVDVVLGATSLHQEEIKRWCAERENYHFHCPAKNMAEIMENADLAIGAGGTTTWERCCLGLPSLVIQIANNQKELIHQGLAINIFEYLGDMATLNVTDIVEKLNEIATNPRRLKLMSQNGMNLVDGLGAQRISAEMLTI